MAVAIRVRVLLFARLRELAGTPACDVEVPAGATARDAWRAATAQHPRLEEGSGGMRVARNQRYGGWDDVLADGDEVAFIPPVAGGASAVHVLLTDRPLDPAAVQDLVRTDADGAVCCFVGTVRDHADGRPVTLLEYEAYASMAEAEMRRVGEEVLRRTGATAIALHHRVGALRIGEASVVVAASAPHRPAAFEACRLGIDILKADVPIWKKEHGPGGAVWVDDTAHTH